eukprot:4716668-Pleurochrysis_carterae.AAC.1
MDNCHDGGEFSGGRAEGALGEGSRSRPGCLQGVARASQPPQRRVVAEARPPCHAVLVAAVGGVLECPRDAGPVRLERRVEGEAGEGVVLLQVPAPTLRHRLNALGRCPRAQLRN